MERERAVVPGGKQFLCRRDILGVPGVLDGLSHVVSVCEEKKKYIDISRAEAAASSYFCHFVRSGKAIYHNLLYALGILHQLN